MPNPSLAVGHSSSTDGPAWCFDANELPRFHPALLPLLLGKHQHSRETSSGMSFSSKKSMLESPASPASESHARSLCGLQPAQPLFILCDAPAAPRRFSRRCSRRYSQRGSRRFSWRCSRRFYRLRPSCAPLLSLLPPWVIVHFSSLHFGLCPRVNLVALNSVHRRSGMRLSIRNSVTIAPLPCVMIISSLDWALFLTTTTQRSQLPLSLNQTDLHLHMFLPNSEKRLE